MRTTLDLDAELLQAAKEIASSQGITTGQAVSNLMRKALAPAPGAPRVRNGVPLLPRRPAGSAPITMMLVNQLRDE
jgi:hypothetical protein